MKVSSMRSKAILLALLTLAVGSVRAEFVDSSRAAAAARNVASSLSAQDRLGTTVESVAAHSTSNNAVFYTVKMKEGGTVFMSSDDEESPVIGYAPGKVDYSTIDKRGPLWALLNRGVSGRKAAREARLRANAATPSFVRTAKSSWAALTAKAPLKAAPVLGAGVSSFDRVPPLVQSCWDQDGYDGTSGDQSKCCYSYYTPVLTNGLHAVCGCVATAMAQVMRYWRYPAQAEHVERTCYVSPHWEKVVVVDAKGVTRNDYVHAGETNLWTSGTPYDWDNMLYVPTANETVRKAIGQLTSDAGISVCMCYDTLAKGGSGALSFNCPDAFKDVFHYGAAALWDVDTYSNPNFMLDAQNAVLANLDAGCPVLFGISGAPGGHSIVCDGYQMTPNLYVHLNMGWSGTDNSFYLLDPFSAKTVAGTFDYFSDAVVNIFPHGDENTSIISGRITDLANKPVEGATVTLFAAGSASVSVTSVTTSATGIYAFFVNDEGPVAYDLEAVSPDGKTIARLGNVSSRRTSLTSSRARTSVIEGNPPPTPPGKDAWIAEYVSKSVVGTVGNSWGNDMTLVDPAIVVRTSNHEFKGLDFPRALASAEAFSREDGEPADIEILKPIDLPTDRWALNFNCTFHAAGDSDSVPVTRIGDAVLVVKEGFRAVFSNIVFTAGGTVVAVETNAVAAFAGTVGPKGVGLGVELADGGKIEIAGALDTSCSYVVNDRRTTEKQGSEPFGFASVDYETATNCASLFVNAGNDELVGVVASDTSGVPLVWGAAPLPDSAADATLVQNGTRVNYRKLATAINSARAEADLVIRRSCMLAGEYSIAGHKLTMRAEEPNVVLTPANATDITAFVVGEGGEWAISNLVVSGFSVFAKKRSAGGVFISVKAGGVFRMQDGARLEDIKNTYDTYGAIKAAAGSKVVLEEGSVIAGCSSQGGGGGIYLSASAHLDLCGGAITNCMAGSDGGGGVYAKNGADISVSGPSVVWNNFHQEGSNEPVQDNIYLVNGQPIVDGAVSGGKVGVRWDGSNAKNNDPGGIVATFADGLSDGEKEASAESFLSDVNGDWYEGVVAAVSDDKTKLVWAKSGHEPGTVPEEEGKIVVDRAGKILYFKELHYAFDRLTGGVARVTLKANCELIGNQGDVAVRGDVTLDGAGFMIGRGGDYRLFVTGEGNALTLTNVTVKGKTLAGGYSGDRSLLRAEDGGRIVLEAGAVVCDVKGGSETWRTSAGVSVWNANLVMYDGAAVRDCANKKTDGAGGGIIVGGTNAVFRFEGGEVTGCSATTGGGVQIDNGATILISGSGRITGNPKGGNLYVADKSALVLEDVFSGSVGYTEGIKGDTNVFGRVAADCPTPVWELAPGVMGFHRDADQRVVGYIATNDTVALLVWADAFADGVYTDEDGTEYGWVDPGAPPPAPEIAPPSPATGLVYNGNEQTGVVVAVGFTLTGNVGTNAGPYTAVAKLEEGYAWTGGSKGDKQIPWSIAKATYDMSGVVFTNVTYVCDGSAKSNFVDEATLPEGVSVTNYLNNGQAAVGEHTVTAQFGGDAVNYEPIADKTATLTITEAPTPPPGPTPEPEYTVTTNDPSLTPLAFSAIERIAETEWKLSVTNLLKDADYALSFTADLTTPFTTGAWFRASANGPWTTNVQFSAEDLKPAYFWRAHGRTTYVTNWLNAVQLQPQP